MPVPVPLSFIHYVSDKTRCRHDYELLKFIARSHAAKVRHRNKANTVVFDKHCSAALGCRNGVEYRFQTPSDDLHPASSCLKEEIAASSPIRISNEPLIATEDKEDGAESEGSQDNSLDQQSKLEAELRPLSPWHWTRGTRVDAFDCVTRSKYYGVSLYLDFLVHYVMPTVVSINEAFNVVNVYGGWILENMAKYEDFFHVLIGLTIVAHTTIAKPGAPLPRDAFVHAGQAMSKLSRLAKPNARADDDAILTILYLAMFERGLGNDDAFNTHRCQVGKMVASRGGVNQLGVDSSARATLTVLLSISGESPSSVPQNQPVTAALPLRPTPRLIRNEDTRLIEKLPIGFRNLARARRFSSDTLQIIHRITEKQGWSPQDSDYREGQDEDKSKVYWPVAGQASNFWDACTAFRTPDGPDGPSLEKLICLALFRYCANRANRWRPRACIYHSVTHLTAQLPTFKVPRFQTERNCLIWIWLVAIDSWAMSINCRELAVEGVHLLSSMREVLPELQDWEWWDLESLGQNFFWWDDLHVLLSANWPSPGHKNRHYGVTS